MQDHSKLIQKILSGSRWATILRILGQAISWLSTIIVVRFLTPEDYGLHSMLDAPLIMMMLFCTLGLDSALVQRKDIHHAEIKEVFGWLIIFNLTLFLALFFGGEVLASYFNEPRLVKLSQVMSFIFLIVPFRVVPNAILSRELKFKLKAQVELAATVVAAIATLVMAYFGAGVWSLVIGVLINRGLQAVLLMILRPWIVMPSFRFKASLQMLSFGGMLTLAGGLALLSDMLVTLLAGPVLGAELLGVYGVAATFAMLPLSKGMPIINQVMLPAFSRLQDDIAAATYYQAKLLGVASIVFFPVMSGMACVSGAFIVTIVGEQWIPSIIPLSLMSIGVMFRMSTILHKTVVTSIGGVRVSLVLSIVQVVLLLPLTIVAAREGVIALIGAWVITEVIVMLAAIQLSKRYLGTSFAGFYNAIKPALIASVVMAGFVMAVRQLLTGGDDLLVLIVQVFVGIIVYSSILWFFFSDNLNTVVKTFFGDRFARYGIGG